MCKKFTLTNNCCVTLAVLENTQFFLSFQNVTFKGQQKISCRVRITQGWLVSIRCVFAEYFLCGSKPILHWNIDTGHPPLLEPICCVDQFIVSANSLCGLICCTCQLTTWVNLMHGDIFALKHWFWVPTTISANSLHEPIYCEGQCAVWVKCVVLGLFTFKHWCWVPTIIGVNSLRGSIHRAEAIHCVVSILHSAIIMQSNLLNKKHFISSQQQESTPPVKKCQKSSISHMNSPHMYTCISN